MPASHIALAALALALASAVAGYALAPASPRSISIEHTGGRLLAVEIEVAR